MAKADSKLRSSGFRFSLTTKGQPDPDHARVLVQGKSNCFMIAQIIQSLYHIMLLMEQREMDFN